MMLQRKEVGVLVETGDKWTLEKGAKSKVNRREPIKRLDSRLD